MKFALIVVYTLIGGRHDGLTMERRIATYGGEYACQSAQQPGKLPLSFRKLKRGKVTFECRQLSDWWT
jgi:hypothetical protein